MQDPIGLMGGWNPYQYPLNPVQGIDPLGLVNVGQGIPGANGNTSVHTNPGPEATDFRPDHALDYIHFDKNDGLRVSTESWNPLSEADAVKMINDIDKRRMTNYNFYTDQKWGKAANYTLCLNSSQLGYDKCESIIIECV